MLLAFLLEVLPCSVLCYIHIGCVSLYTCPVMHSIFLYEALLTVNLTHYFPACRRVVLCILDDGIVPQMVTKLCQCCPVRLYCCGCWLPSKPCLTKFSSVTNTVLQAQYHASVFDVTTVTLKPTSHSVSVTSFSKINLMPVLMSVPL